GNDRIIGRLGDDTLTGGNGADTFVFTTGFEADTVQDYETGIDTLQLSSGLWSGTLTAAQVVSSFATDTGTDVVFDFGGGNIITLVDVATTTGLEGDILIV
ncbi:M10 family metallopeptidase C-terminal domain-containing protein, partial [Rhodalgimonas zhirmunskyi]|nr:peptidase [Rhodoalgimonas zhirmunskyi]